MNAIHEFAPAKINLTLHVTGRRDDGYHLLDSLVVFADIGDSIAITPSRDFGFMIDGPFAGAFTGLDSDAGAQSSNLAMRAAWAMARETGRDHPEALIRLTKNLPVASGIGGASSDAAAVIRGLCRLWDIAPDADFIAPLALSLGADVPVCLRAQSCIMRGIGDGISPAPRVPDTGIVLVNPLTPCPTPDVFRHYAISKTAFSKPANIPAAWHGSGDFLASLTEGQNDLTPCARQIVPAIGDALTAIAAQDGCKLSRMSGSGATCFGLFPDRNAAHVAASSLRHGHPEWWVSDGKIN